MGAFLLHERGADIHEADLREAFAERGFEGVQRIELGTAVLHLAAKRHLGLRNLVVRELPGEPSATLAVTGTLVYDGLPWNEALDRLMDDLTGNGIRIDRLAGAFCAIFHRPGRQEAPVVLCDPSGIYHLFQDDAGGLLSSSQLIALAAGNRRWTIDRSACLDLLTSGYLVAPRTILRELRLATGACPPVPVPWYTFQARLADILDIPVVRGGLQDHVEFQLHGLREHLGLCKGLFREFGVDMGLSGGYDSRLLILLAHDRTFPFSCHTHVKDDDFTDRRIAREIAGILGLELAELAADSPGDMDSRALEANLASSYAFYDGHAVEMMNLLRPEYTPEYRVRALGPMGINLSGVGGEIYRNYNYTCPGGRMDARDWTAYYVVNHLNLGCIAPEAARHALVERQKTAILSAMGASGRNTMDFLLARRYYGEVWLPNWHGVRNSVESSLALYLTPFSDRRVVRNALASTGRIGVHGAFEAAMIRALDRDVAAIDSSYGHPFTRIPLSHTLKAGLRAWIPNRMKLRMAEKLGRRPLDTQRADRLCAAHPVLRRAVERIGRLGLPLDMERFLSGPSMMYLAFSLGYVLERLEHRTVLPVDKGEFLEERGTR